MRDHLGGHQAVAGPSSPPLPEFAAAAGRISWTRATTSPRCRATSPVSCPVARWAAAEIVTADPPPRRGGLGVRGSPGPTRFCPRSACTTTLTPGIAAARDRRHHRCDAPPCRAAHRRDQRLPGRRTTSSSGRSRTRLAMIPAMGSSCGGGRAADRQDPVRQGLRRPRPDGRPGRASPGWTGPGQVFCSRHRQAAHRPLPHRRRAQRTRRPVHPPRQRRPLPLAVLGQPDTTGQVIGIAT